MPRHEVGRLGEVALADVEQHQDGLLGQEAEAADRLLLVGVEVEVPDRRARLEAGMEPLEDDLLALGGLALGRRPVPAARLEALEPALRHRQVGEQELEVEPLEVAGGVDAPVGMRVGGILEGTDDVQERVRVAQAGEVVGLAVPRSRCGPPTRAAGPAGRRR